MKSSFVWVFLASLLVFLVSLSVYTGVHVMLYERIISPPPTQIHYQHERIHVDYTTSHTEGTVLFLLPPPGHYRYGTIDKSFELLQANYLKTYPCDVTLLYEGDLPEGFVERTREKLSSAKKIHFVPWGIDTKEIPEDYPEEFKDWMRNDPLNQWPLGYKKMCWFFSGKVFYHPALENYKYYWRLDTDSYILEPIPYDIFERFRTKNCLYGYRFMTHEGPPVTNELWDTFKRWQQNQNLSIPYDSWVWQMISPRYDLSDYSGLMFYNNFEVVDIAWFKNPYYQSYFKTLEEAGGFWHWRWGDAPIRSLAVAYLINPNQICAMPGFCYDHQSNRCKDGVPVFTDFEYTPPNVEL